MKRLRISLAFGLLATSFGMADDEILSVRPPVVLTKPAELKPPVATTPVDVIPPVRVPDVISDPTPNPQRIWANAELLLWWMKPAAARPLISTGSSADLLPGALGQPSTQVIYGENDLGYGVQTGFRFGLGGWLDDSRTLGLEFSAILFSQDAGDPFAARGANLYIPVTVTDPATPGRFIIADPADGFRGQLGYTSAIRLWGFETNALSQMMDVQPCVLNGIAGFRYLDLSEQLGLAARSDDLFLGGTLTFNEHLRTRNQFYGGQVGVEAVVSEGRFFASLRSTVALGVTQQARDFRALSVSTTPPAGVFPEGVFVQGTNSGRRTHHDFSVVPQVGLKLGMDIFPFLRLSAGYDFMYWGNVIRPTEEIDQTINFTQSNGGRLFGTARPYPLFHGTDFWLHGIQFGMELRF